VVLYGVSYMQLCLELGVQEMISTYRKKRMGIQLRRQNIASNDSDGVCVKAGKAPL
jgi:hypothetical protein